MTAGHDGLTPIREGERLLGLDALRGFAIFGIFMVNMAFMSMPLGEVIEPGVPDLAPADQAAWVIVRTLFEFKFVTIFSMLFGAGLMVQQTRADVKGQSFAPTAVRRLLVLAVIGAVHAFGLWYGDILLQYAAVGSIAVFVLVMRPTTRTLVGLGVLCFILGLLGVTGCTGLGALQAQQLAAAEETVSGAGADRLREAQTPDSVSGDTGTVTDTDDDTDSGADDPDGPYVPAACRAIANSPLGPNEPIWLEAEIVAYRDGPAVDAFVFRTASYMGAVFFALIPFFGWRILSMFLLGAAMMRSGFFGSTRGDWHRRAMWAGFAVGLPLEIAATAIAWREQWTHDWTILLHTPLHYVASLLLALGLAGAIAAMAARRSAIMRIVFAPVGRMALTCYLAETVIATFIMNWWGLGRFGEFGRMEQLGLVVVIYAGLVVFASLWMRFFVIGPMEWLWRSISYLRPLPILRHAQENPS